MIRPSDVIEINEVTDDLISLTLMVIASGRPIDVRVDGAAQVLTQASSIR